MGSALLLALSSCSGRQPGLGETDLDPSDTRPLFEAQEDQELTEGSGESGYAGFAMADFNADGHPDLVVGTRLGIIGFCAAPLGQRHGVYWQSDFYRENFRRGSRLNLVSCDDLDEDGCDEILVTTLASRESNWHLRIHDATGGELIADIVLPSGRDRNEDGFWDGHYYAIGTLPGICGAGGPGVVLVVEVGYDIDGRGLLVVDPRSGEKIWGYATGPNPSAQASWIGDLDGDGREEILLGGGSPNNLRGDLVNATSDDRARLFAISATGQLLWSQAFGVHYYSLRFAVGDLDGDGTQEIAVATRHHSAGPYADSLAVLDAASGRKLAMIPTPATCNGIAIGRSHADGGAYVYLATSTGTITRFRFRDRSLKQDIVARSSSSVSLVGVADILPMPGDEVIASVGKQGIVLDGELQILAQFENPIRDPGSFLLCHVWRQDPHPALLVISNGTRRMAVWFRPFPKELPSGILMAAVGLALAAALGFGIRRYQRSARNGSIPRTRDILVRILQGLEESSHGSLSTMKSLKHLENRLGYAGEDEALHGRFREQIEHNYGDFIESCYPRLIEILDQAAQAGLDPALIRATRAALEATRERLLKLAATGFAFAEIPGNLSEIKQYNAQIDEGFAAIRKAVVSRFATDVVAMLKRMLKLAEADLTQSGVAIRFAGGEIAGEMICLIAAQDLRFILENLIDNARKAMAEAPRRELTVGVQREDKLGVIRITDTGRGMAPQDQVAIFTRGQTAKGGGLGLYRSREILKPWRGELLLEASEPGRGSSFALRLHLV